MKCSVCEEEIKDEGDLFYGDEATYYEGKPLCETCYYEDEPTATIFYK